MIVTINQLERNTADDSVVTAHWSVNLTDGDYSASSYGSASFTRDADSPTFIEFADLTESDVVGWVKASMYSETQVSPEPNEDGTISTAMLTKVVDGMAEVEANLQAQIDEQKAPTMVSGTPWSEAVLEEVA